MTYIIYTVHRYMYTYSMTISKIIFVCSNASSFWPVAWKFELKRLSLPILTLTVGHGRHSERQRVCGPLQRIQGVPKMPRQEWSLSKCKGVELLLLPCKGKHWIQNLRLSWINLVLGVKGKSFNGYMYNITMTYIHLYDLQGGRER